MNDDLVSPILLLLFFFLQQITFLWQNTKKVLSFPLRFCTLIMLNILMSDSNVISKTKQSLPSRGMETSTQIWMKQKAARDIQLWQNDQHLWIVQNKLYDLSSYVDSHPGGGHWLAYTKGQDITSHFITHHLNQDKARAVLQKYFVGQAKKKQEPVFTFQHKGLFRKVKRRILEKYSPAELQDTSKSFINGCVFLVLWILSFLAMAHQRSYLLAILCSTLMFPIIGVAHNFIHMKNHPFRFLFLITGFTHVEWQIMHCISHHAYANTLVDYQIQALEPVIYYLKTSPQNKKINWLIKQLVLPLGPLLNILLRTIITPLTKRMLPDFLFLTPLIQIPLIYLITNDLILSLKLFTTMHVVFGFLFLKLTFLGHRTGAEWTAGNVEIRDFAEHQIYASSDTPTNNCRGFWSYLLYAGFNFHAIHHIFPTIDNHSLPEVSDLFEQQASKMGIRLNKLKNVFSGLIQIEKNFFKRKVWKKE